MNLRDSLQKGRVRFGRHRAFLLRYIAHEEWNKSQKTRRISAIVMLFFSRFLFEVKKNDSNRLMLNTIICRKVSRPKMVFKK